MKRDEFLQNVIKKDKEKSTCIGEGFMIPHGRITQMGDHTSGVMGISRQGLDFNADDGKPIHVIVLLAAPDDGKHRLEVLSALSQALGQDRNIRDQIIKSRNAAHAYQILHADETDDFNYFLEDAFNENKNTTNS